jgi:DNA-binding NarL/FixJ family response regulator
MNHPLERLGQGFEVKTNGVAGPWGSSEVGSQSIARPYLNQSVVAIVDKRVLQRESLACGVIEHNSTLSVSTVASLDELQSLRAETEVSVVLVVLAGRTLTDQVVRTELAQFVADMGSIPVIVVADSDEPVQILAALECGAKGFIPTSVSVRVAAEAIGLALAGGTFVPANSVLALRDAIYASSELAHPMQGLFTSREVVVAEALRKGKSNKIIAYELNLCESTVKVHIRNIMKKLKATNRTEIAYKLRTMLP